MTLLEAELLEETDEQIEARKIAEREAQVLESQTKLVRHLEQTARDKAAAEDDDLVDDIDDDDAVDIEAALDQWKLRELRRLTRDQKELDEEEGGAARNRTSTTHVGRRDPGRERQADGRVVKGKRNFLQKDYHAGAFYQVAYPRYCSPIC